MATSEKGGVVLPACKADDFHSLRANLYTIYLAFFAFCARACLNLFLLQTESLCDCVKCFSLSPRLLKTSCHFWDATVSPVLYLNENGGLANDALQRKTAKGINIIRWLIGRTQHESSASSPTNVIITPFFHAACRHNIISVFLCKPCRMERVDTSSSRS